MQIIFRLALILYIITAVAQAQNGKLPSVNIGDPAPPLRIREWVKGSPISTFEKGKVYVVEFWATWCRPCIASMPHLSLLAREYEGSVIVLGVDIFETKNTSTNTIKTFVNSMGKRMDFNVALPDSDYMVKDWLEATGERPLHGIPRTCVVDGEGRLVWIGHPIDLAVVLPKIVDKSWDIKKELVKRNLEQHLASLDDSVKFELMKYVDTKNSVNILNPDSALFEINEIVQKEPKLKCAPNIAYYTFNALLNTNLQKAYDYGKEVLLTRTYEDPAYDAIINTIKTGADKLSLPTNIYELGAEAYQLKIDRIPYPETIDFMYKLYDKMAEWYWRANNKAKAIDSQQKAIEMLARKKDSSKSALATLETQLHQYQKQ